MKTHLHSTGMKKELDGLAKAEAYLNNNVSMSEITVPVLTQVSQEYRVSLDILCTTYNSILVANAKNEFAKITSDGERFPSLNDLDILMSTYNVTEEILGL